MFEVFHVHVIRCAKKRWVVYDTLTNYLYKFTQTKVYYTKSSTL